MDAEIRGYRQRWIAQLILTILGQGISFVGFILTTLFRTNTMPEKWLAIGGFWFGLGLLLFTASRIAIPYADPIILPLVLTLTGIGLAFLYRYDLTSNQDPMFYTQFLAVAVGVGCLLVIIFLLKDPRRLKGYPFILSALGFVLLLLPLIPGLGSSAYGSRIWISIGGFSFQPAEVAKIVLAAAFAAYLSDKREVLSMAGNRILGLDLPRMRDLGPVMVMWGMSLAIMVFQNDLGTSLLFFGLFVMMIYVATGKGSWVILGLVLFAAGGAAVVKFASHVQRRIDFWLRPFDYPNDATQIIQAQFGFSHGGLLGSGWGMGRPDLIIFAYSDMVAASIGEEIGIVGLMAIVALYGILVFRGLKTSLVTVDPFTKLFAAGLSFAFLLQTFSIIGGVTRLLPLTGLTTPFLSQGGSSMIANWILIALLLVMSHQARRPHAQIGEASAWGITALGEESTQVFSSRELAQIGIGEIHPIQEINAEQVRLTLTGQPMIAGGDDTGVPNEETTEVVPNLDAQFYPNRTRYELAPESLFVPQEPKPAPQIPTSFEDDDDDYFGKGTE
ncbi:MAG: FtsW/RodA/SpoVE family cell cycle protein [Propionibacteriaceae bacterium]|jgi:cell division protein FtsW (lipid II flippase)|nr:FtsW/RodA/SpoVE family cell cycle protein [Propionibacteriaceae bacterium]